MKCILPSMALVLALLASPALRPATAEDWPCWRGPNRDAVCEEKGLLQAWPDGGPRLLWKTTGVGEGYSGPAVVGNMLYTMGNGNGKQWIVALDVTRKGQQVWASATGGIHHDGGGFPGPRSTPTIDGDRLYTLGVAGELVCMNLRDGTIRWQHHMVRDFGGAIPTWGYAESVLIDGDRLICTPGGRQATLAALNKLTGEPVWKSPIGDGACYSSIIKATIGNIPQYVAFVSNGVVGVRASDGQFLWRYNAPALTKNGGISIATPIAYGQTIFAAAGYGVGGGLVWVRPVGRQFQPRQVYFTKDMKNHHGGLIRLGDYLYGCNDPGILTCLNYKTGKVVWRSREPGKCSLLYADGMLYCRDEKGPISLVEATPEGFRMKGRFQQPGRSNKNAWPHLVIADGRMYVRDQDALLCYDVRAAKR